MSTPKYPNRDALREANDIYLDYMRLFIIHHLKQVRGEKVEDLIAKALKKQASEFRWAFEKNDDIADAIDHSYLPLIVKEHWERFAQRLDWDLNFQSMLWLIKEGRNKCEHRGTKDLDIEFVRMNLFLIADVLGKINRPDEQHEVEIIRDKLDDPAEQLAATLERLQAAESENAEHKRALSEAEKQLKAAESEKAEYEERNTSLSKQVDEKESRVKKLSKQLKKAKEENDRHKKNLAGAKQRLEKFEATQADYKKRLETMSKELKLAKREHRASEKHRVDTSNQLAQVQAEKKRIVERLAVVPETLSIFPPLDIDSAVRILDRRGTDKQKYLSNLLDQNQPAIIYVQSEERINQLLRTVVPEKADIIETHDAQTSDRQEIEILAKLGRSESIAVVSNSTFSTTAPSPCFEHFVFCHLPPGLDKFFRQCEPAFTPGKEAYLHLIYDSERDISGLVQKYPDETVLREFYAKLKEFKGIYRDFINPDRIYNELDIEKPIIDTGFAIFEELDLLKQNEEGVKLLSPSGKKLDESETYCGGEELKREVKNFRVFELEKSIEEIWGKIEEMKNLPL